MHRFLLAVLAMAVPMSLASTGRRVRTTSNLVRAGETVTLNVKLDKAPNFAGGQLATRVAPENSSVKSFLHAATTDAQQGQQEFSIRIPIPLGGPAGVWHVENLTFTLPNGEVKPLKFKDVDFTVLPRASVVVPESASLRVQ